MRVPRSNTLVAHALAHQGKEQALEMHSFCSLKRPPLLDFMFFSFDFKDCSITLNPVDLIPSNMDPSGMCCNVPILIYD